MTEIEIESAKIKDNIFCEYSYSEIVENPKDNRNNSVTVSSDAPIHSDLTNSFRQLIPHMAIICEEVPNHDSDIQIIDDIEADTDGKFTRFAVTHFSISSSGENQGVVIMGLKKLSNGEQITLKTPKVKFFESNYSYAQELYAAVQKCKEEVKEYHFGKRAPNPQMELFDSEDGLSEEGGVEISFTVTADKKRGKRKPIEA